MLSPRDTVRTPPVLVRPVLVRLVNDELLMTRMVVVAMEVVRFVMVEDEFAMMPPVNVRRLEAVSAWSLLRNEVVAIPLNVTASCATNAEGTVPSILRGLISPSHAGVEVPPTSTPR